MLEKIRDFDDLQQALWSFASHRVITVAGRTGILTALSAGYRTAEALAVELNLDPLAVGKMARALTALGICEASEESFRVRPELSIYFGESPGSLEPFLEHSHSLYDRWGENLEAWVRGEPWKTKKRDSDGVNKFGRAMEAMGVNVADDAAASMDLSGAERMLDVGGGFGHYAKAFLAASPKLEAVVLDVPGVAELGRKNAVGTEFEGRIEFVGGDYLDDDWRKDLDIVLIANVLHQENEKSAAEMIRKGAVSLRPGGSLAVVDFAIDDDRRENITGALFAINMRSFGDTHTEPKIRRWMSAAGLGRIERTDLNPLRWLIVGRRPL
jgi:ubiquinone/menaquinone biosynthesis C-methylase UbiE